MIKRIILLNLIFATALSAQIITINFNEATTDSTLKELSGIISGPLPSYGSVAPDITTQLQDIGVTSIRNNDYTDDRLDMERLFNCKGPLTDTLSTYPNWNGSPLDTNNYFWNESDILFQSFIDGGFEPLFRVGGESGCAIKEYDYKGPRRYEESNYIEAAKKVVKHYLEYNGAAQNFEYLNLWTEYPNTLFWDRSAFEFNHFWKNLYVELKTEFPQLKIGGPGFLVSFYEYETDTISDRVNAAITFLDTLYQNNIKPDWLGFHYIYNSVTLLQEDIDYFKKLLKGTPPFDFVPWAGTDFFSDSELICDAYMLALFDVDSLGNTITLTNEQIDALYNRSKGASLLTAYWILLQRNRIEKAYYYRAGDSNSDPALDPNDPNQKMRRGLFWGDAEGSYKKTAYGFKMQNSLQREGYNQILKFNDQMKIGETDSLWIIGATKDDENFAVLISNISTERKKINFSLDNLPITIDDYDIQFSVVDENNDGDIWRELDFNNLILPSYSITLVKFSKKIVSVELEENKKYSFELLQNYPNPFNPSTVIKYSIPTSVGRESLVVSLKVYDVLGREVATLVNKEQAPGNYKVEFRTDSVPTVSSGIYYYRLKAGDFVQSKKMILIK